MDESHQQIMRASRAAVEDSNARILHSAWAAYVTRKILRSAGQRIYQSRERLSGNGIGPAAFERQAGRISRIVISRHRPENGKYLESNNLD